VQKCVIIFVFEMDGRMWNKVGFGGAVRGYKTYF
jgi:hypothetical protein